jgi:protein tyrosine phosphatase (PTP) superfamily phosphohydrolase (DUF442 family)
MTKLYQKFLTVLAFLRVLLFGSSAPRGQRLSVKSQEGSGKTIRLAFCGKMKSGKDTAARMLTILRGGTTIHMFASGYRWTERLLLYPLFGAKIDTENKTKLERLALQWVGYWGRVLFGKDVWIRGTLKMIKNTPGNVYVVGVRYPNEIEKLKQIGVQSVWIERPEADRIAAGAFNLNHETETALDGYTGFDYRIPNDKDLGTFRRRVECYAHIGKLLEMVGGGVDHAYRLRTINTENCPAPWDPLDTRLLETNGWQPSDPAKETTDPTETGDHDEEAGVLDERFKWLDSREIANEIRRFADIVQHELVVTDSKTAVESVRKTLHSILDNRPIDGKPEQPKTKDEVLAEVQALTESIGVQHMLLIEESPEEVRAALNYYKMVQSNKKKKTKRSKKSSKSLTKKKKKTQTKTAAKKRK